MPEIDEQTQAYESSQSRFVGRAFFAPVVFALLIAAGWVMLAALITPGVALEGALGEQQRFMRGVLVYSGLALNFGLASMVSLRLCFINE